MGVHDYDLGVIGGGSAGLTAAAGGAMAGARTLLVEREPALGGDCLHHGCVPSKTLIHSARVRHLMTQARRFGLPAVDLPPVDFRAVRARIDEVVAAIQKHDSRERFCGLGAAVEHGAAEFVDDHAIRLDHRVVSARHWIIATGSRAAVPDIPGLEATPFLTNRELFRLERLPGSMIVLGAGPVAVEMAQAFVRLGTRVEVVHRGSQILGREDRDMADLVMARLAEEGVTFHLDREVARVADLGHARQVIVRDAAGRESRLAAECILVALGRRPNLEGLNLAAAGVESSPAGLVLDHRLRTSRRHILGAGDVTGRHLFTHAAAYEAGVALANAVFRLPRRVDYRLMPWCTYCDPELASVGLNERAAREAGLAVTTLVEEFGDNDRARTAGQGHGRIKLVIDAAEKPVGVQILGPHAGELMGEWVAALGGGVRLSTLAGAVHPYPTLAEISKRVAGRLLAAKIFSDRVRKGLRLFFSLRGRACGPGS